MIDIVVTLLQLVASNILPTIKNVIDIERSELELTNNTDVGLTAPQLVAKHGYPIEIHTVETFDGYLLDVHRIPYGKKNEINEGNIYSRRPVVFLMIGLLCSSADWIAAGPEKALAYLLADKGYDVWIGNARGTTYSRKHTKYNPDVDSIFWKYSWHEMGVYDLPAMIDYVLNHTSQTDLSYIGHSQGTTSFFVMTSEKPNYNNKIKVMIALAPVAFMTHVDSIILRLIAAFETELEMMCNLFGMYEVMKNSPTTKFIGEVMCNLVDNEEVVQSAGLCANVLFMISGYDKKQLNETLIPVILSNLPAGAATGQIFHYAQSVKNGGKFRQYDHGKSKNYQKYNQTTPPEYKLFRITTPISLMYADNDLLTSPIDVKYLNKQLPNVIQLYSVPQESFNHLDFLYAIEVDRLVYDNIFKILENYNFS